MKQFKKMLNKEIRQQKNQSRIMDWLIDGEKIEPIYREMVKKEFYEYMLFLKFAEIGEKHLKQTFNECTKLSFGSDVCEECSFLKYCKVFNKMIKEIKMPFEPTEKDNEKTFHFIAEEDANGIPFIQHFYLTWSSHDNCFWDKSHKDYDLAFYTKDYKLVHLWEHFDGEHETKYNILFCERWEK